MDNLELQKKSLKVQALLERVSSLTTQYESQVADLRVELTITQNALSQVNEELTSLKESLENSVQTQEDPDADV